MANEKIVNRNNLKTFRQELDKRYAKPDGYYPTMTIGLADNLTPYSEDSGAEQSKPFISNGTGTNNNTEIVTVGDYGLLRSKNGNTLVVNQLAQNPDFESTSYWNVVSGTRTVNNNIITLTDNSTNAGYLTQSLSQPIPSGHKVLLMINVVSLGETFNNVSFRLFNNYTSDQGISVANIGFNTVIIDTNSEKNRIDIRANGTHGSGNYFSVSKVRVVDLTQMFGSNDLIPQDLLDNPSHFSWYYNGSLAYNTGSLENANGVKLVSTGRNIWDEQWEVGTISYLNGENLPESRVRSKNYICVIPNTVYYQNYKNDRSLSINVFFYDINKSFISATSQFTVDTNGLFTTPSNCYYVRFIVNTSYGTTYKNDITISLYYTPEQGGEGYSNYYPYEAPYEVDTGSEVLRKAGNAYDVKVSSSAITRRIGSYTFTGNESWTVENGYAYAIISNLNGKLSSLNIIGDTSAISKYQIGSSNGNVLAIYLDTTTYDTSAKINALTTGKTIYYELATETTEQGTPFAENLPINDYGMLYWLDENDELVGIPQGAKIFYPTNYKGFVDDMYSRVDGDSSQYVIQSELSEYVKQTDLSSGITDVAGLTYTSKKAYKVGNVVTLSIMAQNATGNNIANGTTLFNLNSSLKPIIGVLVGYANNANCVFGISSNGDTNCSISLPNNSFIFINISYAIA